MNIQELYPKAHFQQATPEAKPPFYIAYGTEDNLKAAVKVLQDKKTLNKALSTRGPKELTPLMVASAKGSEVAVNLLLSNGADTEHVDHNGWTALHHAEASGHPKIGDVLRDRSPTLDQTKNKWGATALDLRTMLTPSDPETTPFRYRDSSGEIVTGDVKKFAELTNGAILTNTLVATPESLYFEWSKPATCVQDSSIERYIRSKTKDTPPAPLYIAQVEGKGWGLFCERDLEPGEYVGDYIGELHAKDRVDSTYGMGSIDGQKVRNLLTMANDGLPNMDRYLLTDFKGYSFGIPFITHEKVSAHTELTFNYGYGYWADKMSYHRPSRVEEAEIFFSEHSLKDLFSELTSTGDFHDDPTTMLRHSAMMSYLYSTPSLQFYLMLKGIVDIDDFTEILNHPEWENWQNKFGGNSEIINQIDTSIKISRHIIQHWNKSVKDSIADYFLEGLSKHKFLTMRNVIANIASSPREDWREVAESHIESESFRTDFTYEISSILSDKKDSEDVYEEYKDRAASLDATKLAQVLIYFTKSIQNITPIKNKQNDILNLIMQLFKL